MAFWPPHVNKTPPAQTKLVSPMRHCTAGSMPITENPFFRLALVACPSRRWVTP
jgi:hypothetical protein